MKNYVFKAKKYGLQLVTTLKYEGNVGSHGFGTSSDLRVNQ